MVSTITPPSGGPSKLPTPWVKIIAPKAVVSWSSPIMSTTIGEARAQNADWEHPNKKERPLLVRKFELKTNKKGTNPPEVKIIVIS